MQRVDATPTLRDPVTQRRQRFADLKRLVKSKRQPGRQRGAELPIAPLPDGAQHLQHAPGEAAADEDFRVKRFEIVAGADDGAVDFPCFRRGFDARELNLSHGRSIS